MWKHFDYECKSCGHVFEEMVNSEDAVPCPSCAGETVRLLAAPRVDWKRMGLDPAFPSAYDKWAKEQTRHHTGK